MRQLPPNICQLYEITRSLKVKCTHTRVGTHDKAMHKYITHSKYCIYVVDRITCLVCMLYEITRSLKLKCTHTCWYTRQSHTQVHYTKQILCVYVVDMITCVVHV